MKITKSKMIFALMLASLSAMQSPVAAASENGATWFRAAIEGPNASAFEPFTLVAKDFTLKTKLKWEWVQKSLEWMRLDTYRVIPRGKVILWLPDTKPLRYLGQTYTPQYIPAKSAYRVELLLVFFDDEENFIQTATEKILIEYAPQRPVTENVSVDVSCSRFQVKVDASKMKTSWLHVGCRMLHTQSRAGVEPKLDLIVTWDKPSSGIAQTFNLDRNAHDFTLQNKDESIHVQYQIAPVFSKLSLSLGIGPYLNQDQWVPFATLYASYLISDDTRLACFTALPIRSNPQLDVGLYLVLQQFRTFDEHLNVNLLLGAHALYFSAFGKYESKFSAPQGLELIYRDFLRKSSNFSLGGFFYPSASGRYYVNTWVRYGSSRLFYELNFIHWKETLQDNVNSFSAKSMGLSVGFPIW